MQPKTQAPLHTPRMRRLGPGRWLVESRSRAGIGYPCTVDACGCMAGKHGRMCHHRKLVIRAEAWLASYASPVVPEPMSGAVAAPAPAPAPTVDGAELVERLASAQGIVGPAALATARLLRDQIAQREAASSGATPAVAGDFHASPGYLGLAEAFGL